MSDSNELQKFCEYLDKKKDDFEDNIFIEDFCEKVKRIFSNSKQNRKLIFYIDRHPVSCKNKLCIKNTTRPHNIHIDNITELEFQKQQQNILNNFPDKVSNHIYKWCVAVDSGVIPTYIATKFNNVLTYEHLFILIKLVLDSDSVRFVRFEFLDDEFTKVKDIIDRISKTSSKSFKKLKIYHFVAEVNLTKYYKNLTYVSGTWHDKIRKKGLSIVMVRCK